MSVTASANIQHTWNWPVADKRYPVAMWEGAVQTDGDGSGGDAVGILSFVASARNKLWYSVEECSHIFVNSGDTTAAVWNPSVFLPPLLTGERIWNWTTSVLNTGSATFGGASLLADSTKLRHIIGQTTPAATSLLTVGTSNPGAGKFVRFFARGYVWAVEAPTLPGGFHWVGDSPTPALGNVGSSLQPAP